MLNVRENKCTKICVIIATSHLQGEKAICRSRFALVKTFICRCRFGA